MFKTIFLTQRVFVLVICLLSLSVTKIYADVSPAEKAALIAINNATYGLNWPITTSVDNTWLGVTVENGAVTKLEFPSGVSGRFGSDYVFDVSALVNLRVLSFSNLWNLYGKIQGLKNLTDLQTLKLNDCGLTVNLSELSTLYSLKEINLRQVKSVGALSTLSNLINLENLNLFGCSLDGSLIDITKLVNLTSLNLCRNNLIGSLSDLSGLSKLKYLNLSRDEGSYSKNSFTGSFSALNGMTEIEELDMYNLRFDGNLSDLAALLNLKRLNLGANSLNGSLSDISSLVNLEYLNLSFCGLGGQLPDISSFINVKKLYLADNGFVGALPDLSGLKKLELIDLSINELYDLLPEELAGLPMLQRAYFSHNKFYGNIPSSWSHFTSDFFCEVDFQENNLIGELAFDDRINLWRDWVYGNKFTLKDRMNYTFGNSNGEFYYFNLLIERGSLGFDGLVYQADAHTQQRYGEPKVVNAFVGRSFEYNIDINEGLELEYLWVNRKDCSENDFCGFIAQGSSSNLTESVPRDFYYVEGAGKNNDLETVFTEKGANTYQVLMGKTTGSGTYYYTYDYTAPITINVTYAPEFTKTAVETVAPDNSYTYNVATTDGDGDGMTISAEGILPGNLVLSTTVNDNGTGSATLSGTIAKAGSYPIKLKVTDGLADTFQEFTIVVANSQYTITFDTDGGTAQAEQIYTDGNSEPLLVSTSKPGYTFLYWSINGVKVVNTGELTAGDKTVKAVWEICQNNSFAVNSYDGVEKPYLWSTFLDVPDKSMETLFGNKPIKYIEDTNGSKWYPASSGNVSEFANYVNGSGYAVYPDGDFVWNMCGKERDFTSELISLNGPYTTPNIIGNPYSKKVVIDDVLFGSGIFKRDDIWGIFGITSTGAYNIYIPGDGFEALTWEGSQIPTFEPGQAYYIYYYPDKTVSFSYPSLLPIQGAPSLKAATNTYMPQNVRSLDRFMLLSIDDSAIDIVYEVSAEWRIYSTSGALIGKDYVDNYSLMMIDGYDLKDGESMELRYYSPTSQKEYPVTVLSWTPKSSTSGSTVALEFYHMADLIAEHLTVSTTPVSENTLLAKASSISVYPNPAKDKVTLILDLDDQAKVYGGVYNTSGEYLMTAVDDVLAAGMHNLDINVSLLPSGMYLLKIQVGNRVELVKLVVEK